MLCLLVVALACSRGSTFSGADSSDAGTASSGSDTTDGGVAPDVGASSDAGTVSGGDLDAGALATCAPPQQVATIAPADCPGKPQLLWTLSPANEVDFRGWTDRGGNLYWTEYQPNTYWPAPEATQLVSADRQGNVRYRVPAPSASWNGAFLISGGRIVLSRDATIAAHDVATGAQIWSVDLSATYPNYVRMEGMADLGDGRIAFTLSASGQQIEGSYVIDLATGKILSSFHDVLVLGSDGVGTGLGIPFPRSYYESTTLFGFDTRGQRVWAATASQPWFVGSISGKPIARMSDVHCLTGTDRFLAVPENWLLAMGAGVAFSFDYGTNPVTIHAIRDRQVIADGQLTDANPTIGVGIAPFVVDDHVVAVEQLSSSFPGLCHVVSYGKASIWRIDSATASQCPLDFVGENAIQGVALLPGELVIGRRTFLTDACTQSTQPVTIEAYSFAGIARQ